MSAPPPASLRHLLAGMMPPVPATGDRLISGLSNDSRRVDKGDLFLALRGLHRHGLEFLPAVRRAGAAAIAWEPPYSGKIPSDGDPPLLAVEDLSHEMGRIAGRFYGEPSRRLKLVGITGTDGKTSCAHFIAQALSAAGDGCGILGTLGYGRYGALSAASHTTPDAVTIQRWLATLRDQGMANVVMEVSSHALAQHRVAGLEFAVAVLTNLTRDHLDYHGGIEAYAEAKRRLFLDHDPALAVLNLDDPFGRELAVDIAGAKVGYGLEPHDTARLDGFVWGENLALSESGQQLRVVSSWGHGVLRTGLLGRFNANNLLASLAVLLVLDIPFPEALRRLARVSNAPGRMERFDGGAEHPLAVVDYAHTPDALAQALRTLKEHGHGKLWCVFGCGGDRDPGKRPLMGQAGERFADRIIVTDDNPRDEDPEGIIQDILGGMENPKRARVLRDRRQAIAAALQEAAPEDLVLIAGKGHEDYQLIGDARIPFSDREIVRHYLETAP